MTVAGTKNPINLLIQLWLNPSHHGVPRPCSKRRNTFTTANSAPTACSTSITLLSRDSSLQIPGWLEEEEEGVLWTSRGKRLIQRE